MSTFNSENNINSLADLDFKNLVITLDNKNEIETKIESLLVKEEANIMQALKGFEDIKVKIAKIIQINSKGNSTERENVTQMEKIKTALDNFPINAIEDEIKVTLKKVATNLKQIIENIANKKEEENLQNLEQVINLITKMYLDIEKKKLTFLASLLDHNLLLEETN